MGSSKDVFCGLSEESIPGPDANLSEMEQFARTFDAYEYHGSYKKIVEIAGFKCHESLTDLRTCLYFEERRWRQCKLMGIQPGPQDIAYIKKLIGKIRARVRKSSAC